VPVLGWSVSVGSSWSVERGCRSVGVCGACQSGVRIRVSSHAGHQHQRAGVGKKHARTVDRIRVRVIDRDMSYWPACAFGGFDGGFMGGQGMHRTANNRWTTDAFNILASLYPPFRSTLASFVYCGYGPVPSKATSTVELGDKAVRGATARCLAGTVVVGGGFAISPHTQVSVRALERVAADRWRVLASPLWISHTELTAIAYCGPGPAPKLVSRTIDTQGPLPRTMSGTARATCPVGTTLAFGGAIVTATGSQVIFLETLRAETRSRWSVGGRGGFGGRLTALAYCR
jgi:hypothetical protein